MLVPINWLKEFVDFSLKPEELGQVLTDIGLALEGIQEVQGEPVLEFEVTPNRPDCLSILGIARETAVIAKKPLRVPTSKPLRGEGKTPIRFTHYPAACPRYSAVTIRNVTVKDSPFWLQKRLLQMGMRPINNLVDISNYIMFEWGNPNHIFDLDKIAGGVMTMTKTKGGETITTVDELSYTLPKDTIVIKDAQKIIDLCGIKGGFNTAISSETTNIFIHVPVYTPVWIRRTSQALGLSSEASYIYERGANISNTLKTLERVVQLVSELAGGEVEGKVIDEGQTKVPRRRISVRSSQIESLLGLKITKAKILTILTALDLKPNFKGNLLVCQVPGFRQDLAGAVDLIEELARHYGYNRLPNRLPVGDFPTKPLPYAWNFRAEREIKNILASGGFTEVRSYSLAGPQEIANLNQSPAVFLRVANPVSRDYQYLRQSLLPGLLAAIQANLPQTDQINLFEIGRVFRGSHPGQTKEKPTLAAISLGSSYVHLKGLIEYLAERFNFQVKFLPQKNPGLFFHPSRTASIYSQGQELGKVGEIHPQILLTMGLSGRVFCLELDYDFLVKLAEQRVVKLKLPPAYPQLTEDLTAVFPQKTTLLGEVIREIKKTSRLITNVAVIDQYQEAITLRLTFQSHQRTLSSKDVAKIRVKIINLLEDKFSANVKAQDPGSSASPAS